MATWLRRLARRQVTRAGALLAPGGAWLILFFVVPVAVLAAYSFMPRGMYGGVAPGFTLAHYARFFDPLYLGILVRTVALSAVCTLLCLVAGFPMAFAIARSGRWRTVLLFLVIVPLWTSFLVRTYALIFLLRDNGLINGALLALGVIDAPLQLLYTNGAVLAGLVYGFLPLMILPIYASLEKLDPALLEAAEVLGARPFSRFRRIILPLSAPGTIAGCVLVFIPSLGAFLTPDLLGGARTMMIGSLIQNQFGAARNWPFGAAASMIVMLVVLLTLRVTRGRAGATP
jgi:spermidine/putrescine transport system permease protein